MPFSWGLAEPTAAWLKAFRSPQSRQPLGARDLPSHSRAALHLGPCVGAGAARGSPNRWLHKAWFKISKLWKGKHALEFEVSRVLLLRLCLPQHEETTVVRQGCQPSQACLPRPAAIPAGQDTKQPVWGVQVGHQQRCCCSFALDFQLCGAWSFSCDSRGAAAAGRALRWAPAWPAAGFSTESLEWWGMLLGARGPPERVRGLSGTFISLQRASRACWSSLKC